MAKQLTNFFARIEAYPNSSTPLSDYIDLYHKALELKDAFPQDSQLIANVMVGTTSYAQDKIDNPVLAEIYDHFTQLELPEAHMDKSDGRRSAAKKWRRLHILAPQLHIDTSVEAYPTAQEVYDIFKAELEIAESARRLLDDIDKYKNDSDVVIVLDALLQGRNSYDTSPFYDMIPKQNIPLLCSSMFYELGFYHDEFKNPGISSAPAAQEMLEQYKQQSHKEIAAARKRFNAIKTNEDKETFKKELVAHGVSQKDSKSDREEAHDNLLTAIQHLYVLIKNTDDSTALTHLASVAFNIGSTNRFAYPDIDSIGIDLNEYAGLKAEKDNDWSQTEARKMEKTYSYLAKDLAKKEE